MDTVALVENQIDDGQKLLDRLGEEGIPVRAACWVKPVEEDRWSLYIATPLMEEKAAAGAYRDVYRVLRSLGGVWLNDSDIKLVSDKHPVAQDVLDLLRRFPGRLPTRSNRPILGGLPVEEIFIYPLGKRAAVEVKVYGLVFDGEPGGCLHLSLEPHNPNSRLEVEDHGNRKVYHGKTGFDWVVLAPEGATLERDEVGLMTLNWNLHGNRMRSSANEVWSLAKLGLHGFRFLREPS